MCLQDGSGSFNEAGGSEHFLRRLSDYKKHGQVIQLLWRMYKENRRGIQQGGFVLLNVQLRNKRLCVNMCEDNLK